MSDGLHDFVSTDRGEKPGSGYQPKPQPQPITFEALIPRIAHEKDLSSVQGFPGQVMFINSADYPCKSDCLRCHVEALEQQVQALVERWEDDKPYRDDDYWKGVRVCARQLKELLGKRG